MPSQVYAITRMSPEATRLGARCTMGGRTGRCHRRPRWTLQWRSHHLRRPIIILRDACEKHAREFARRHRLQDV
jgi:hypothetical protein